MACAGKVLVVDAATIHALPGRAVAIATALPVTSPHTVYGIQDSRLVLREAIQPQKRQWFHYQFHSTSTSTNQHTHSTSLHHILIFQIMLIFRSVFKTFEPLHFLRTPVRCNQH